MLASKSLLDAIAEDIIWEFENLLCNNDVKINNKNLDENIFETEESYINKKDYDEMKKKIVKQLEYLEDYFIYDAA